jgi:hypothetical protein
MLEPTGAVTSRLPERPRARQTSPILGVRVARRPRPCTFPRCHAPRGRPWSPCTPRGAPTLAGRTPRYGLSVRPSFVRSRAPPRHHRRSTGRKQTRASSVMGPPPLCLEPWAASSSCAPPAPLHQRPPWRNPGADPPHSQLRRPPPSLTPAIARRRVRFPHGSATSPVPAVPRPPPVGVAEPPRQSCSAPFFGRNRILGEPLVPLRPFPGREHRWLVGIPAGRAALRAKDYIASRQLFPGWVLWIRGVSVKAEKFQGPRWKLAS